MWRRKTYQNMNFLQGGRLAQFAHHYPKSTLINSLVIHHEFAQHIWIYVCFLFFKQPSPVNSVVVRISPFKSRCFFRGQSHLNKAAYTKRTAKVVTMGTFHLPDVLRDISNLVFIPWTLNGPPFFGSCFFPIKWFRSTPERRGRSLGSRYRLVFIRLKERPRFTCITFLNGRTPFLRWLTGTIFLGGKNIVQCPVIWVDMWRYMVHT